MQSVTSNSVALAFKGMEVVECGKIYPDREAQDNWYIKYDCGLIEEWWTYSGMLPNLSSTGNLYYAYKSVTFPIALKAGTVALEFHVFNHSVYGRTPSLWFSTDNNGTNTNTKQQFGIYATYPYANMGNVNVRFHLVGFWK